MELRAPGHVAAPATVVDSHTCGQPTRVVLGGWTSEPGALAADERERLRASDELRRLCVLEPRGRRSMFGAVVVDTAREGCERGVVFMDVDGYPDMCGHATIGVATTLVELGLVEASEFALDTPAGPVGVRVEVRDGRAVEVAFENRPALFGERVEVELDGRPVAVDVAWGGQWYAFAPAGATGLCVEPSAIGALVAAAARLRAALPGALRATDPATRVPPAVGNVVWCDAPRGRADARNVAISAAGAFDRSPCGTATSARLAVLHAQGRLRAGEPFVNESLLGTTYTGRIVRETSVAGRPAVVPEIAGRAWLTGMASLWVDPDDPLRDGYLVGGE